MKRLLVQRITADSGQSLVYLALLLVALLGFAGLALDVGAALIFRRQMQNAADAAALAGARELYLQSTDAAVRGSVEQYAVTNRADSFTATYYPGGQTVGGGAVTGSGVCVVTNATWNTVFMRLLGVDALDVGAEACAATRTDQFGGYVMWAHSQSCSDTIKIPGSRNTITGNMHSNYQVKISGQGNNLVNGRLEYFGVRDNCEKCGPPNITFSPPEENPYSVARVTSWPVWFDIAEIEQLVDERIAAGDTTNYHRIDDDFDPKNQGTLQGLYYVTGKVNISDSENGGNYTIVAEGRINISASRLDVTPFYQGLWLFSNAGEDNKCSDAVKISGSKSQIEGIVFAPRGVVDMSGSDNTSLIGSLVGQAVSISGSDLIIGYPPGTISNVRDIRLILPPN